MGREGIRVREVNEADRGQLASLIHFESYVHRHLDWRPPLEWIGHQPYLLAEKKGRFQAVLACPPDPPKIAWMRVFAVSSQIRVEEGWELLWSATLQRLQEMGSPLVCAISLQQWFGDLLGSAGFEHTQDVVMLMWESSNSLPSPKTLPVHIRSMNYEDLDAVEVVDSASFKREWVNSRLSLENAFMQSVVSTVVEDENGLVGYQISTAGPMGGHLARLAVLPSLQGQGIGFGLVHDLLDEFKRRGVERVTVNTQDDNHASLALYEKAGFKQTGETYRVYQHQI